MQLLTEEERTILKTQHKKERDKHVCDRIKAVLLFDEGWSYRQIAHVLLLSDEAIRRHIEDYTILRKLKPQNGGSTSKLKTEEKQALLKHLEEHTYLYVKDIVFYVKTTFGTEYTIKGMTSWLKLHNFSYKKPILVPGKANSKQQIEWIKSYENLKQTIADDETICFIDGVHPTHNKRPMYVWIRKGQRKTLLSNTGRERINLSGAIDIISKRVVIQEDERLNTESTIQFFKKLEEAYPSTRRVHVFCDNAKYYKNKKVFEYLATSKIQIHFLPPYSPNLNPIERLWKLMNEHVLYNRYYEKFNSFKEAVFGFLERLSNPAAELRALLERRITDNFRVMGI